MASLSTVGIIELMVFEICFYCPNLLYRPPTPHTVYCREYIVFPVSSIISQLFLGLGSELSGKWGRVCFFFLREPTITMLVISLITYLWPDLHF
jgi:hypothetical protein